MKQDWSYITKDRAKMNIMITAYEAISKLAQDAKAANEVSNDHAYATKAEQIAGVILMANAMIESLGDDDE